MENRRSHQVPDIAVSAAFPGELIICKLLDLVMLVIEGQPADVREQLWRWYVEDVKWWRKMFKLE
jgi:hypothetical protein